MSSAFEVTILGSSSATPTSKRFPTAQLLNVSERLFLIDCGEGTQIQLRRYRIKFQRINQIFISHLHGDHYLGLPGLISSLHLLGRQKKLTIYAPAGLQEIVEVQLRISQTVLNYQVEWVELDCKNQALIFEDSQVTVSTLIMNHRIPCVGFLFREKDKPRSLIKEQILAMNVPVSAFHELKMGNDVSLEDGRMIRAEDVSRKNPEPRSYAFCSDTRFSLEIAEKVAGVTLLYHEATFLHELIDRAEKTAHSTALEAGMVAAHAKAGQLLIGHYSVRYNDVEPLRTEAATMFPNVVLAEEGQTYKVLSTGI